MTNCYQIQQSILSTFHSNTKLNKQWSRLILSSYSNQTRINTYDFLAVSNNPDHSWYQWANSYLWDMPMASLSKGIASRNQRPGLSAIVLRWVSECLFYLDAFGSPDVDCWSCHREKDIKQHAVQYAFLTSIFCHLLTASILFQHHERIYQRNSFSEENQKGSSDFCLSRPNLRNASV